MPGGMLARSLWTMAIGLALLLPGTAGAAVTATRDAAALAQSLDSSIVSAAFPFIAPAPVAQCANGLDDDNDSFFDGNDTGCSSPSDNREQNDRAAQCANGADDDSDTFIDFSPPPGSTADPGCASANDDNEVDGAVNPTAACANGSDDDGDGKTDFSGANPDPGCTSASDLDEGSEGVAQVPVNPAAISSSALAGFPTAGGSFAILSSGNSESADKPNSSGATSQANGDPPNSNVHGSGVRDLVKLKVDLDVPASANCAQLDFKFLSEEYPEFVGSSFNDGFVAELDTSDFSATSTGLTAPHNFAFDSQNKVISINTTGFSAEQAAGTTYDGSTPLFRASTPVSPGPHTVFLSVFDQSDQSLDSAAFIDNLRLVNLPTGACTAGATSDFTPPETTIVTGPASSTTDTTPTFEFTASEPGATFQCRLDGAEFTPCASPFTTSVLGVGAHTFEVRAIDSAGNIDPTSSSHAFTVLGPPGDKDADGIPDNVDTNDGSLPPVPGKTVNVQVVTGDVFIKVGGGTARAAAVDPTVLPGPQKGYIPLKGAATIPIGAEVDVEEGRVELRSAADRKGGVQRSQFYAGVFKIKQAAAKKAKTFTTDVDLTVTNSRFRKMCAPAAKPASTPVAGAAAKKKTDKRKVANLWGNGTGRFRTSGRSSAATVRGTIWLTQERCDGTLTQVQRGTVSVFDFGRRRSVLVKAGHTYLARATRAQLRARQR